MKLLKFSAALALTLVCNQSYAGLCEPTYGAVPSPTWGPQILHYSCNGQGQYERLSDCNLHCGKFSRTSASENGDDSETAPVIQPANYQREETSSAEPLTDI